MHYARITALALAATVIGACAEQPTTTDPTRSLAPSDLPSLITNGTPTGTSYGYVAAVLIDEGGDGTLNAICTGTLISPTVLLTAGHCTENPPNSKIYVSFQPDVLPLVNAAPLILATSFATHPQYSFPYNDIGVVILPAGSTAGITPAVLPTLGYLDQVLARGGKGTTNTINVGYGVASLGRGKLTGDLDGVRKVQTDTRIQQLRADFLVLQNNAVNAGKGATCYGDSGGPVFLETNNRLIVGVTSYGTDAGCRVHAGFVRLDTQAARSFLGNYVTLP